MHRTVALGALAAALLCSCGSEERRSAPYIGPALYTNVLSNQDTSGRPQNETTIAIHPEDRGNLVGGWNDYRAFDGVHLGFGSTRDGGVTWTDGLVPEPENREQGDPAVAVSADGEFYMAMISFNRFNNEGGIYVARSDDGGRSFQRAVRVQADPDIFEDKEYIAVDRSTSRRRGQVYVTWTDFDDRRFHTEIRVASSTDRGQSWTASTSVSGPVSYSRGFVQGSVPAVGLDGALYVAWFDERGDFSALGRKGWLEGHGPPLEEQLALRRALGAGSSLLAQLVPGLELVPNRVPQARRLRSAQAARILVARSTDGGRTFGPPTAVATVGPLPFDLPYRTNSFPALAVASFGPHFLRAELIAVTYASGNGRDSDVFVATSTDRGRTFSAPVRVSDDTNGATQFFPWLAVDETGAIHVIWYDRRDDPRGAGVDLYYAKSLDAGRSFTANRRVTPGSFDPFTDFGGQFIGDYNGIAAAGGVGYALWTDTRRGGQDVFYAPLE
jgi:hypothetical protein